MGNVVSNEVNTQGDDVQSKKPQNVINSVSLYRTPSGHVHFESNLKGSPDKISFGSSIPLPITSSLMMLNDKVLYHDQFPILPQTPSQIDEDQQALSQNTPTNLTDSITDPRSPSVTRTPLESIPFGKVKISFEKVCQNTENYGNNDQSPLREVQSNRSVPYETLNEADPARNECAQSRSNCTHIISSGAK